MRTGRDGYVCACARRDSVGSAAAPAAKCRNLRRGSFIKSSLRRRAKRVDAQYVNEKTGMPTAPMLPIAMIGIPARPAGSFEIKLYRLAADEKGGIKCLFLARTGPPAMSAVRSLPEGKRTWLAQPRLVEMDPMQTWARFAERI